MEKCIAYLRVSTGDQSNSLEVQEKKINEYCLFKNLQLVDIITDEDVSGFKEFAKRPGGKKVNEYFESGINIIVAIKPDRLFRNVKDALITVDEWNENEIDLHIVDMGGSSFTTQTAIGRLMFTTVISFAEFERGVTAERIKVVLNNKKKTGKAYCASVFGFDNIKGELVPNPIEQEVIERIKVLYTEKAFTTNRIARILNNVGYTTKKNKKFYHSTIQAIIENSLHKSGN